MSDHAGDIAYYLARDLAAAHPHLLVTEPRGDHATESFVVQSQAWWFRVTVEEVDFADITEEEDCRPKLGAPSENLLTSPPSQSGSLRSA